jgi:hypothetical protein
VRGIARGAIDRLGGVVDRQAAKDSATVAKEVARLQGLARQQTQVGSRYGENTLRVANGLAPDISEGLSETQQRAIAMLSDADFKEMMDDVANNTMKEIPGQVARSRAAQKAAAELAQNQSREAAKRTAEHFATPIWKTDIAPRLETLGENALLGGIAGGATGGATGLVASMTGSTPTQSLLYGAISGIGTSALSGGSGFKTLAKNAMAIPRVQGAALNSLARAGNNTAGAFAKAGRAVTPLAEEEQDAIQAFLSGG